MSNLGENSPVFRYVRGMGDRAVKSLRQDPIHVERLFMISYGVENLMSLFFFNYHHLVDRLTRGVAVDAALLPKISEAVVQTDPVRLGLPLLSLEFRNHFDEIVCQVYHGAARTLRMILETSISLADFCLDEERLRAKQIVEGLRAGNLSQEALFLSSPAPVLAERFRYQERHRLFLPFSRLVQRVSKDVHFANQSEVIRVWSDLSKYSHFSSRPYIQSIEQYSAQQTSGPFLQQLYDYALDVVDIAFFVLIQSEAYFLDTDVEALILEIGHWVSTPIATNLMIEIPIMREREFVERQKKFFPNSYPLIAALDKEIRPKRLGID